MKVKQIVSELDGSNGSLAPIQGQQAGKQQYKVAPNSAPAQPGQKQMVKLVPANAPHGAPGQDPQGTVTVSADQIDMTDPANPKLNPQALNPQAQTPNQQPNAMNGKTVTMGLGEEPNEDMLAPNSTPNAQNDWSATKPIPRPDNTNTLKLGPMKDGKLTLSDGEFLTVSQSGKEFDAAQATIEYNKHANRVGYLILNGIQYIVINVGHEWRVGPRAYKAIMANYAPHNKVNQPLQQEEQGEDSPLSRIAHLAGIR